MKIIKKVVKIFLILIGIFIGGIIIAGNLHPSVDTDKAETVGFYFGQGIFYSTLIFLFIWAIIGSYRRRRKR